MKINAMVQVADRRIDLQQFELPKIRSDEGLLRVEACGLCGSDLEQFDGLLRKKGLVEYPMIPGHEPVGVIEEIGRDAQAAWGLKSGDRVSVIPLLNCGRCNYCLGGSHHLCTSFLPDSKLPVSYGYVPTSVGSGLWGGYSEYICLNPRTLFCKIPPKVPARLATLYQALACGLRWAVAIPQAAMGDTVLVLGCGQRGLASVIALKKAGVSRIIVTGLEKDAFKLDMARRLGATETIVADREDVVERVMQLTNGKGVDIAVDIVPVSVQPILDAVELVKMGGVIIIAGAKGGTSRALIDTDKLLVREITMRGVRTQTYNFYVEAMELLADDLDRISPLHTHEFRMTDVEEAIHTLNGDRPGEEAISITIHPDSYFT